MSPEDSWVAKWQRISNFKPGVYAVTVTGWLPPGMSRLPGRMVSYHIFYQSGGLLFSKLCYCACSILHKHCQTN
uniref:Spt4/RpoE2 zinc finger domain-containing protein n=1 Tax=Salmo trutta TaxID=8032 RepID=A0A673YX40_SALTR